MVHVNGDEIFDCLLYQQCHYRAFFGQDLYMYVVWPILTRFSPTVRSTVSDIFFISIKRVLTVIVSFNV